MTFRSNDPSTFDEIDGIVVDESAPASSIAGARTNTVIMVGAFQRGPLTLQSVSSISEIQQLYGKSTFSGNQALKNKKFASLKIIRAAAAAAAKSTLTVDDVSDVATIRFDAKYVGVYGDGLKVTIAAGSTSGKKYTFTDTNTGAILPAEVYDNVVITAVGTTFADSQLMDVTVLSTAAEPITTSITALASGADGTIADSDYQTALAIAEVEGAGNILFLDVNNATRNGYLKTHAANSQDKVCILSNGVTTSVVGTAVSDAITAVSTLRDSDGRLIYAMNPVQTSLDGVLTYTDPASWYAALLSQIHPSIDPAFAKNTQYLSGVTGLKYAFTRAQHISLKDAGISAFEFDNDIGFKVKSGVVTQIADTSKRTVLRRRMADFLSTSAARFLKAYQNSVNSQENRTAVAGAILNFVGAQETLKVLPKDSEVKSGKAKLVDVDSPNTDLSIGQGFFYVVWKQRIYSSMRFIVLQAEIGETVVVTES